MTSNKLLILSLYLFTNRRWKLCIQQPAESSAAIPNVGHCETFLVFKPNAPKHGQSFVIRSLNKVNLTEILEDQSRVECMKPFQCS